MPLKIAYLGPEGSYTHQAVIQQFGNSQQETILYAQKLISDCFKVLNTREVDYAIVPFENSTNGQIVFTYDLIRNWFIPSSQKCSTTLTETSLSEMHNPKFRIVAEQFVIIHHYFLTNAKSISDIKTIYSHPQVWTQVSSFTAKNISSNINKIDTSSTSKAAELASEDKTNTTACISSQISADIYNLSIMFKNIEDNHDNTTRFLVLGYKMPPLASLPPVEFNLMNYYYITLIIFTLNHDNPGALCVALNSFRQYNINLASINSRPSNLKQWQYLFFVEIIGNLEKDDNVIKSIKSLKKNCLDLVVLGSFQRNWRYWSSC